MIERIIQGIANLNIKHKKSPYGKLTVSAGIADTQTEQHKDANWKEVIERADEALYSAKANGRNGFAIQESDEDETSINYGVAL